MGKLTNSRHALVILILVLMSQSFAVSATICPMMMNMDSSSMQMDMSMDHSSHDMSQSQFNEQDESCCDETNCKTMNCASSFLLSTGQVKPVLGIAFTLNERFRSLKLSDVATTPYRPPII